MAKIKECPFCGGESSVKIVGHHTMPFRVECSRCHATSSFCETEALAVFRWNCRSLKAVDEPEENTDLNALLYEYAKSIREEDGMSGIHADNIRRFLAEIPTETVTVLNRVRAIQDIAVRNPWKGGSQAYLATEHWNEGWTECVQEVLKRLNGEKSDRENG